MDFITFLQSQWTVISATPWVFITFGILVFAIAYAILKWRYEAIIDTQKSDNSSLKQKLDLIQHAAPPPQQATTSLMSIDFPIRVAKGNDLGYGIRLGGEYYKIALEIVTTDWGVYEDQGKVKSGWLFADSRYGIFQAIAFFKIHLRNAGTGYIHIADVANPPHKIWFETGLSPTQSGSFAWSEQKDAKRNGIWEFSWK